MGLHGEAFRAALGTGISRVLGLVREVSLAHFFGASGELDAFWIAFLVPNILRRLFAEGGISLAFIPVYLRAEREGEGRGFLRASLSFSLLFFPLLCLLGAAAAPLYVPLLAGGFPMERIELASHLARTLFPFLGLVGLAALFSGLLNVRGSFLLPSLSPAFLSLGAIAGAAAAGGLGLSVEALVFGFLAGGLLQVLVLAFPLRGELSLGRPWHPGLLEVGRRLLPALAGLVLAEINAIVDNRLASALEPGAISVLQYGMRLFQLPLGVVAVSVGVAALPRLSRRALERRWGEFGKELRRGVSLSLGLVLPAMAGLAALGEPIIGLLFGHGAFGGTEVARTYGVLLGYVVGIWGYALMHLFARSFHALGLVRYPVVAGGVAVATNVVLDIALAGPLGAFGLALATGIAGCVGAALSGALLQRKVKGFMPWGEIIRFLVGALVMGGAVRALDVSLLLLGAPEAARALVGMAAGLALYLPFFGTGNLRGLLRGIFPGGG